MGSATEQSHDGEVPFHRGELRLQELFNEQAKAKRISFSVRRGFVDRTAKSLAGMSLLAVTVRVDDALECFLLSGPPGFLCARDATTLVIAPEHPLPDRLLDACRAGAAIGTTGVDFSSGVRVRVNGIVGVEGDGAIVVRTEEVFPNCKLHVAARESVPHPDASVPMPRPEDWVPSAQLLFIASWRGDGTGLDIAHRAGPPGFIEFSDGRLRYEDYYGNGMYQSLGNLDLHPRVTILVVDLERGWGLACQGSTTLEMTHDKSRRWVATAIASMEATAMPPRRWSLTAAD